MRRTDRYPIAIAISLILASFTLTPLTEDRTFLGSSWLLTLLICAAGLILRRTRLRSTGALVTQLVVYLGFLALTANRLQPVDGANTLQRAVQLFLDAGEHMRTQAAPMQVDNGVTFVFIASLGAITILTDVLVVALRKPALGLAPPLTAYLVPAIGLGTDIGIRPFIFIAVGYLAILLAQALNTYAGWPRGLSRDTLGGSVQEQAGAVVWRAALYVAVPAVVLTLVAGAAIPTISLPGWGFGGTGNGGGGPLRLTDPTLDLKRNLTLPANRVVMTYRTNKPSGQYLRMASLPAFSQAGWQNAQTSIEEGEKLPDPVGLTEPTGKVRRTTIKIGDFSSEYLPLPYVPTSFKAAGRWGYDPNSLVVISSDRGTDRNSATKNLDYTVVSRDVTPSAKTLNDIISGDPPDADLTTAVPTDLPENIKKLTDRVTEDAGTPAQKAAAIQSYLRDPDNFTYSTKPRPGSGYQALENFFFKDKSGYCEQFAAAMAIMARLVGIPSRVAVGFLPGTKKNGVWTVTARDAHAWPELYFSGYGWIRYEPTPGVQTGTAPNWTLEHSTTPDDSTSQAPTESQPTFQSQPTVRAQRPDTTADNQAAPTASSFPWKRVLGFGGGALLLLALLSAPAAVRIGRRRHRIGLGAHRGPAEVPDPADQVEAGWVEVRDTIRDLGRRWPNGSPRTIVTEIGRQKSPAVQDALSELATLVEAGRYSRTFTDAAAAAAVPELVRTIRRGLLADRSRRGRLGITLFPRSVLHRR
jgi:transglutaminase-like putative cysteine protease